MHIPRLSLAAIASHARPLQVSGLILALSTVLCAQALDYSDLPALPNTARHGAVYDDARERIVMFGGLTESGLSADTWESDGYSWERRAAANGPSARELHAMAYDAAREQTVVFGGALDAAGTVSNETWTWGGTSWALMQPSTSPAPQAGAAMTYDPVAQRVVLFGGTGPAGAPGNTWIWDGANWLQANPGFAPPQGGPAAMAFDQNRQHVILVNEVGSWEWDGATWTPLPLPQYWLGGQLLSVAMAFDEVRQELVCQAGWWGQTWILSSSGWIRHPTAQLFRAEQAVVFDRGQSALLSVGGRRARYSPVYQTNFHVWEPATRVSQWDGSSWNQVHVGVADADQLVASPLSGSTLAIYPYHSVWGSSLEARTWDGREWLPMPEPIGVGIHYAASVLDTQRAKVVRFGGTGPGPTVLEAQPLDTLAEWDGTSWSYPQPSAAPPARQGHAMAYDQQRGRAIVFGGSMYHQQHASFDDTWEWDGATWHQGTPTTHPTARWGSRMAYDPIRGRTVLFGGLSPSGPSTETWEWDGTNWTLMAPANHPPAAAKFAMAWHPVRQRVLVYSGPQLREWDGSNWSLVPTQRPLPPPNGSAMAFDTTRGAMIMHGASTTRLLGSAVTSPSIQDLGGACATGTTSPQLEVQPLRIGNEVFRATIRDGSAQAPVVTLVSLVWQPTSISGCTLAVGLDSLMLLESTNLSGNTDVFTQMPFSPSLRGVDLFVQAVVADPTATIGIASTRALQVRIGD